jgi:hypothetical protein
VQQRHSAPKGNGTLACLNTIKEGKASSLAVICIDMEAWQSPLEFCQFLGADYSAYTPLLLFPVFFLLFMPIFWLLANSGLTLATISEQSQLVTVFPANIIMPKLDSEAPAHDAASVTT